MVEQVDEKSDVGKTWGLKLRDLQITSAMTMGGLLFLFKTVYCRKRICCSVSAVSDSLWSWGLQHARLPCPSPSPGVCSNSYPLTQWWHPTITSSVIPFFSCPQSFPTLGSYPMSWLFPSGGQSIGTSASASILPMNIEGWFPLRFGLISNTYFF